MFKSFCSLTICNTVIAFSWQPDLQLIFSLPKLTLPPSTPRHRNSKEQFNLLYGSLNIEDSVDFPILQQCYYVIVEPFMKAGMVEEMTAIENPDDVMGGICILADLALMFVLVFCMGEFFLLSQWDLSFVVNGVQYLVIDIVGKVFFVQRVLLRDGLIFSATTIAYGYNGKNKKKKQNW